MDVVSVVTPSVHPGKCLPPKLFGKPKANSLPIRWSKQQQQKTFKTSNS